MDPFGKVTEVEQFDGYLPIEECDLVSYLVIHTSFISMRQFKARKGLEAYNQFIRGWIKEPENQNIHLV